MKITKLIRKTSGGHHGWYETDQGYNVRKPLGLIYNQEVEKKIENNLERSYPVVTIKTSWWKKLLNWLCG